MDEMPDPEFHELFDRTTNYIDLRGKVTVNQISKELWKAREQCKSLYLRAKNMYERANYRNAIAGYDNLIRYGFANRTIKEALANPRGFIANTLIYGKIEAKRRLDAQRRSRMRFYRRPDYRR
jgi:hypothetical protein